MGKRNRKLKTPEQRQAVRRRAVDYWVLAPLRILLLAGIGAGLGFGAYQIARFMHTSNVLAVRCLEVHGTSRTTAGELIEAAGLREGMNIFSVDLNLVQRRVVANPWVRRALARRIVPDRIVLEVEEHMPVLLVSLEGLYVVDIDGEVFKRLQPGEHLDLPVITGLSRSLVGEDPERARRDLLQAMQLVERFEREECLAGRSVAEIHLDDLLGVSLVLDPGAQTVRFGQKRDRGRLQVLCRFLEELESREVTASTILMDHPDRPGWATVRTDEKRRLRRTLSNEGERI